MAMIMDMKKLSAMVIAFGVVLFQLLPFSLASQDLEPLSNNETESLNETLRTNGTNGDGNKTLEEIVYFGTGFKVGLVIAAIATVGAILVCVFIRMNAPSHAGGERFPDPMVPLPDGVV